MKKIVHKFLDHFYYVDDNSIHCLDTIHKVSAYKISSELEEVFNLPKKTIKWYVKSWTKSYNKNFDFKSFWVVHSFFFPVAKRIFPRLVSNDLVEVQPMNPPTGLRYIMGADVARTSEAPAAIIERLNAGNEIEAWRYIRTFFLEN